LRIENENVLGNEITITPIILDMSKYDEISDFEDPIPSSRATSGSYFNTSAFDVFKSTARANYYRDLAFYEYTNERTSSISFAITNPSKETVTDVSVIITIEKSRDKFSIFNPNKLPDYPESHKSNIPAPPNFLTNLHLTEQLIKKDSTFELEDFDDFYRINLTFRKVQPKQTIFCNKVICIGALDNFALEAKITIYADNLPEPIESAITINCIAEHKTIKFRGLSDTPTVSGLNLGDLNIKVKKRSTDQ